MYVHRRMFENARSLRRALIAISVAIGACIKKHVAVSVYKSLHLCTISSFIGVSVHDMARSIEHGRQKIARGGGSHGRKSVSLLDPSGHYGIHIALLYCRHIAQGKDTATGPFLRRSQSRDTCNK